MNATISPEFEDFTNNQRRPGFFAVYSSTVGSLTFALNVCLVMMVITLKLDKNSNRFLFLIELAAGGSLYGMFSALRSFMEIWMTYALPKAFKFLTIISTGGIHGATWNLVAVVVDQYILIAYPLQYHTIMTRKRAFGLVSGIAVLIIMNCSVMISIWDDSAHPAYYPNLPFWHHLSALIFLMVIPLGIITGLKFKTIMISRQHMRQIQDLQWTTQPTHLTGKIARRHWSGVVTTTLICAALVFSWLPMTMVFAWHVIFGVGFENETFTALNSHSACIYLTYGLWVPFIYVFRSPEMKQICANKRIRCS